MRVRKIFAPCAMALAALAIPATSAHAQSPATHDRDVMSAAVHRGQYNKDSAPDATSRAILQVPIERLYGATRPIGDVTAAMHAAFPQIIEQNFARLDKTQMEALVNGLSEAELSDLAQLYVNATSDTGAPQRLLKVMAHRLSSKHLGRISRHFGFASVYEAVNSEAPTKRNDFIDASNPSHQAPTVGELRFGPTGKFAPRSATMMTTAYRPDLDSFGFEMRPTAGGSGGF